MFFLLLQIGTFSTKVVCGFYRVCSTELLIIPLVDLNIGTTTGRPGYLQLQMLPLNLVDITAALNLLVQNVFARFWQNPIHLGAKLYYFLLLR